MIGYEACKSILMAVGLAVITIFLFVALTGLGAGVEYSCRNKIIPCPSHYLLGEDAR